MQCAAAAVRALQCKRQRAAGGAGIDAKRAKLPPPPAATPGSRALRVKQEHARACTTKPLQDEQPAHVLRGELSPSVMLTKIVTRAERTAAARAQQFDLDSIATPSSSTPGIPLIDRRSARLASLSSYASRDAPGVQMSAAPVKVKSEHRKRKNVKVSHVKAKSEAAAKKKAAPKKKSAKTKKAAKAGGEPYPNHRAPSAKECALAVRLMQKQHPEFTKRQKKTRGSISDGEASLTGACGKRRTLLDSLVGTILSQNTTDINSHRAFMSLKAAFPSWSNLLEGRPEDVVEAIKSGGLAEIKEARIRVILETLVAERGSPPSLEYLHKLTNDDVKAELSRFKGCGPKTISCVLMFAMERAEFPVDTHVWKIALKLGWVPAAATRESTYLHLNKRVPDELKYDLHVMLVEHGKRFKNDLSCLSEVKKLTRKQSATRQETPRPDVLRK